MASKKDAADEGTPALPHAEGDAESVFSDSEEEGELPVGRRDVASDADDDDEEGPAGKHRRTLGEATDETLQRLDKLTLDGAAPAADVAEGELGSEKGEVAEDGYESEVEDEGPRQEESELERASSRPPPRKPLEPYEVPSSGAFWMHDNRQGEDNGSARPARRPKKKLYEPDDDGERWQHDRFELLDMPPEMDTYQGFIEKRTSGRGGARRRDYGNGYPGSPTMAPPGWDGNENPLLPVEDWDAVKPVQAGAAAGGGREGAPSYGQRGRGRRPPRRGRQLDSPADVHDAGWDAQVMEPERGSGSGGNRRGGRGGGGGGYGRSSNAYGNGVPSTNTAWYNSGSGNNSTRGGAGHSGAHAGGRQEQHRQPAAIEQWPSLPGQAEEVAPPPGWAPKPDQAQAGGWDSGWDVPQPQHQQQQHQQQQPAQQQLNVAAKDYNPQGAQPHIAFGSTDGIATMPYVPYVQQPLPEDGVAYGILTDASGFVPGPMQQLAGAPNQAIQPEARRPLAIQAPLDQNQAAGFQAPLPSAYQDFGGVQPAGDAARQGRGRGGRRYSAMAGSVAAS